LASASAIPIPFLDNYRILLVLLWLLLFFGGCLLPALVGMMIGSVTKNLRAFANSTA
jgi:MFS transporter, Spinster family, sphingosine-1-phosphate transporter